MGVVRVPKPTRSVGWLIGLLVSVVTLLLVRSVFFPSFADDHGLKAMLEWDTSNRDGYFSCLAEDIERNPGKWDVSGGFELRPPPARFESQNAYFSLHSRNGVHRMKYAPEGRVEILNYSLIGLRDHRLIGFRCGPKPPEHTVAVDFIEWATEVQSQDPKLGVRVVGEVPSRGANSPGGFAGRTTVGPLTISTASGLALDVPPLTPGGNSCLKRVSEIPRSRPNKVRRCGIIGGYAEDGTVAWYRVITSDVVLPDRPPPTQSIGNLIDIRDGLAFVQDGWLLPIAEDVDVCGTPVRHGGSLEALEEALPPGKSLTRDTRAVLDLSRQEITTIECR